MTVDNGGVLNIGNGGGRTFIGGSNSDGKNGTGILTISSGGLVNVAAPGGFPNDQIYLAGYGGTGTLNLNGGTLSTARGIANGGSSTIYFNGGTLQAAASNGNWISVTQAYVQAGGAIIDTQGYTVAINQTLATDPALGSTPDGGLTKIGAGLLALGGQNTYIGATNVTAGTLQLNNGGQGGTLSGSGPINIYGGATLLGAATDALGYYNQAGTNIVNINEGGTLSVASGNRLSMDREVNSVGGTIASQSPSSGDGSGQTYTFRDSNGGLYNFTSAADGTPSTISATNLGLNGNVTFNVTAGGGPIDLNVSGTLADNFGTGNLIKAGNGVMVLAAANTYSGATSMSGGTLDLTNSAAIQNSTLTMTGSGTLLFDSSVSANAFTLGGLQSGKFGPRLRHRLAKRHRRAPSP